MKTTLNGKLFLTVLNNSTIQQRLKHFKIYRKHKYGNLTAFICTYGNVADNLNLI
jgi:hypothetical protein